ncbi:major facilitator superfamily permease [Klebsiella pneumoniae]|uniref:Major facilitator superfamily permease n=1 Tax=Klebsiella pneumoniae TaxID=573 RepID=A0A2X3FQY8_KLEPN|nr:major facilitator superfamily permease [Klebsiella pneumoniae]
MVPRFATLGRIPKGVWVLGGVSLLMDVSSEMIHSLLPLFMATTLGASVIIIGLIEGLGGSHRPDPEGLLRRDQRLCRQA